MCGCGFGEHSVSSTSIGGSSGGNSYWTCKETQVMTCRVTIDAKDPAHDMVHQWAAHHHIHQTVQYLHHHIH